MPCCEKRINIELSKARYILEGTKRSLREIVNKIVRVHESAERYKYSPLNIVHPSNQSMTYRLGV